MKALFKILSVLLVAVLFSGCLYNFIVPEDIVVIDPDDPNAVQISFSTDILPIFASKCTSCHKAGGTSPNLTADNAYAALGSYINTSSPADSKIVTQPNPDNTGSHPKYTAAEAALVLGWIQQGAKNN